MKNNNYDSECIGKIKEIKVKGLDYPSTIIVNYEVDNKTYEIKENLVLKKNITKKISFIPIGYTTKRLIELKSGVPAKVGNSVKVKYCSSDPSKAFLPDNDSKTTLL